MQTWNAERLALSLLGVAMLACLPPRPAHSDEGMWTFDNFPSAAVKAKYGVDIDPAWLDHGAAVRLSTGCSASIVTANGIVLSNHHCVGNCGSVERRMTCALVRSRIPC
jgi:hypothetical protein